MTLLLRAHFVRGDLYRSRNLFDAAIADYTAVIQCDPSFEPGYRKRAECYEQLPLFECYTK